jgi:aminobenzoyl-glutamate utilization protein B
LEKKMSIQAEKQAMIKWLDENASRFTKISDDIWETPELAYKEFVASKLQADFLEAEGFSITWDIAGMNTAFIAEWGEDKPVLGFIGEYDALPGLSQKNQPTPEPIIEGGSGQGCGHNLLGTAAVASALAIKRWLESNGTKGVVRYYGCPAEEDGAGKVYMARDGFYDDLDAAFNFHPGKLNTPSKGSCVGVNSIYYRFHGVTSHAGGSPHLGRSALDAVELMNVGVNYLREHVKDDVRIHYTITNGGKAPNIVPDEAEVYYYIRAAQPDYLEEVTERVRKVGQGAAMMTETTFEEIFNVGCAPMLSNHYLADLHYEAMEFIGPIEFTEEEIKYAQTINDGFPSTNSENIDWMIERGNPSDESIEELEKFRDAPIIGENFEALDENVVDTGSTDVGDLSLVTPVSLLETACFTTGSTGHSWGNVATCAMSIGHKGMMHAAKAMALAAVDVYSDPKHLIEIRKEFDKATGGKSYQCTLPEGFMPPRYEPEMA